MRTRLQSPFSHAEFWQAERAAFFVSGAFRQDTTGQPYYPVSDSHANCWLIIGEVPDDIDGVPLPVVIGQFASRDMAEWVCHLILQS